MANQNNSSTNDFNAKRLAIINQISQHKDLADATRLHARDELQMFDQLFRKGIRARKMLQGYLCWSQNFQNNFKIQGLDIIHQEIIALDHPLDIILLKIIPIGQALSNHIRNVAACQEAISTSLDLVSRATSVNQLTNFEVPKLVRNFSIEQLDFSHLEMEWNAMELDTRLTYWITEMKRVLSAHLQVQK